MKDFDVGPLPYFLYLILLVPVVIGFELGGFWTYLTPLYLFGLIGVLDLLVGRKNASNLEQKYTLISRMVPICWLPVQLGLIVWLLLVAKSGQYSIFELIGLTLSVGFVCGAVGIVCAHELIHRKHWLEHRIANVFMISVFYYHFCIEHVYGHHRKVGTFNDPATARLGESFYRFFLRLSTRKVLFIISYVW